MPKPLVAAAPDFTLLGAVSAAPPLLAVPDVALPLPPLVDDFPDTDAGCSRRLATRVRTSAGRVRSFDNRSSARNALDEVI